MSGTHHALDRFGAGVLHRTGARGLLHRVGLPSASTEPLPSDSAEVAHLLRAPAFRSQVRDLAERLGRSEEDMLAEAAGALREMSAMHNEAVIAQWQRFGRWMRLPAPDPYQPPTKRKPVRRVAPPSGQAQRTRRM